MDEVPITVQIDSDEAYPVYYMASPGSGIGLTCLLSAADIERIRLADDEYEACQDIMRAAYKLVTDLELRRLRGDPTAFTEEERAQWPKNQAEHEARRERARQAMADLFAKQKGQR